MHFYFEGSRTKMSSETIAGHGDPFDGFAPGPGHLFFLVVAGSAPARDGIEILGTIRLALLGLFLHFFAKNNPEPIRITHGLVFSKNFNSLILAVFLNVVSCKFLFYSYRPKNLYTYQLN